MLNKFEGGDTVKVGYEDQWYECHLPPVGYVWDKKEKKLVKTGILNSGKSPKKQKWEREGLPKEWSKWISEEKVKREKNPSYYHPEAHEIRTKAWFRRYNGVWFWNYNPFTGESEPVYLTGMWYMYLNWWKADFGYPYFRWVDHKVFYLLELVIEDPNSFGLLLATLRRFGKTAILGLFMYEYPSRARNAYAGMQSTTKDDAKKVFTQGIVYPWKNLPDFFRPKYDYNSTQTTEIAFRSPTPKGKTSLLYVNSEDDSLHSIINYKDASIYAYDGYKNHRYAMEEPGKTDDVAKRWGVVRPTMEVRGKIIGKCFAPTTVEEGVGEDYVKLWKRSDINRRTPNGRTLSGLYSMFIPAYEAYIFDTYGHSIVEDPKVKVYDIDTGELIEKGAKTILENEREALKGNSEEYNSFVRKFPFSIKDAFRFQNHNCLFDEAKIYDQIDVLSFKENLTIRGNFVWVNGEKDSRVVFEKDRTGRWELCWHPEHESETNQKVFKSGMWWPKNDIQFASGVDPYDHKRTDSAENTLSLAASHVIHKFDYNTAEFFHNRFVCQYLYRHKTPLLFYEDMIKQCVYFGCSLLVEKNKPGIMDYFEERGYAPYLMRLPGEKHPGINAPTSDGQKQFFVEFIEAYVYEHCEKVVFTKLLEDWAKFDITDTKKFDLSMSSAYTLIAAKNKMFKEKKEKAKADNFNMYYKKHKVKQLS